jgi:formylglycine-generating enzyme required for sulfatase activity
MLGNLEPQLVAIPTGKFVMGTSEEEIHWLAENTDWGCSVKRDYFKDEQPQHEVMLGEYQIGRYPVTNLEYQAFVQSTGHRPPMHWKGNDAPEEISDHPVTFICYDDAIAFCEWLSKLTEKPYRLPTEAEWEKAARGTDGRIYPWGAEFEVKFCNTEESGIQSTTPVGQYSPDGDGPYGCADMSGNVWEWCSDWYVEKYYQNSPVEDPMGLTESAWRVVRGASWFSNQRRARCAARNRFEPDNCHNHIGFRVALTPSSSERQ